MSTYQVPMMRYPAKGLEKLTAEPDYHIEVEFQPTNTPGLIVTPALVDGEPQDDRWTLTHEHTGLCFPFTFESTADAQRTASAVADLADWNDPELLFDLLRPSAADRLKEMGEIARAEGGVSG